MLLCQIVVFLLFMGVAKGVNRIAGRPLMNGAQYYLIAAAILLIVGLMVQFSAFLKPDDTRALEQVPMGIGKMIGAFFLPVVAAIYYSNKFSRAKEPASSEPTPPQP
jgi:hypothetical protein